ncbi:MAG: hypothetical protein IEMM0008_1020 [bacterium]|nr:MAG: hypothetical protein IEMM0008_1020 [bacterium]
MGKSMKFLSILLVLSLFVLSACVKGGNNNSSCGGSFTESEPNSTVGTANDFGITFTPGCSITISGNILSGEIDGFDINTGNASNLTFTLTWSSGNDGADIGYLNSAGTIIGAFATATVDLETGTVNVTAAQNANRIVTVDATAVGANNAGAYTLTITAN